MASDHDSLARIARTDQQDARTEDVQRAARRHGLIDGARAGAFFRALVEEGAPIQLAHVMTGNYIVTTIRDHAACHTDDVS